MNEAVVGQEAVELMALNEPAWTERVWFPAIVMGTLSSAALAIGTAAWSYPFFFVEVMTDGPALSSLPVWLEASPPSSDVWVAASPLPFLTLILVTKEVPFQPRPSELSLLHYPISLFLELLSSIKLDASAFIWFEAVGIWMKLSISLELLLT